MFADDTNLFCSHKDIKTRFEIVNAELILMQDWFNANKLSLNVTKTNYSLFHPSRKEKNLPLPLPKKTTNAK